ncbi:hypothetical protein K1719_000358 [Acacia pycnantha]|nr:hypothetical protein K1719_000358 [Acacia pycnantha]
MFKKFPNLEIDTRKSPFLKNKIDPIPHYWATCTREQSPFLKESKNKGMARRHDGDYVSISSRYSVGVNSKKKKKRGPGLPDQSTSPVDQVWFGPFVLQLSYYAQIEENMAGHGHEEDMDDLVDEFKHLKSVRKRSRKCKLEEGRGYYVSFIKEILCDLRRR